MPTTEELQDLLTDELRDAFDAEKQLVKALRSMIRAAQSEELQEALSAHLDETTEHVATLESVFDVLDMKPRGKHCAGMAGILEEGKEAVAEADEAVRDMVIIASSRRVEHYEMAAYMVLMDLATALGNDEIVEHFQGILDEEMAAEETLAELGRTLGEITEDEEEDEEEMEEGAEVEEPVGAGSGGRGARARGAAPKRGRRS